MHSGGLLTFVFYSSILDAAIAVTNAIAQLIKAATVSQHEVNLQSVVTWPAWATNYIWQ